MNLNSFVYFVLTLAIANAAVWMGAVPKTPPKFAGQEGCYIAEENRVIPFDTDATPIGVCYRISCGKELMSYASCGVVMGDDGCIISEEDLTKPYPDCCPTMKCNEV